MITYILSKDHKETAKMLDDKTLGKMRGEVLKILTQDYVGSSYSMDAKIREMWRGYEGSLLLYGIAMCNEWTNRGKRDFIGRKLYAVFTFRKWDDGAFDQPHWMNDTGYYKVLGFIDAMKNKLWWSGNQAWYKFAFNNVQPSYSDLHIPSGRPA